MNLVTTKQRRLKMKINVTELVANPNNPRRISKEKKTRLKQSILLFPKMLDYRDITINKEKMVLGGNQRTEILKEILNSSPMDWILIMSGNEKWKKLNPAQQEKIVDYWKEWVENPMVEVSEAKDFTEKEEKEFVFKDNEEYGEYDYDRLAKLHDQVTLINFGFDEGLFYDPSEDETIEKKRASGKSGKKINVLVFGKNSIAATKREYNELVAKYEKYVDDTGVDFGFVNYLLNKLKTKEDGDTKHS